MTPELSAVAVVNGESSPLVRVGPIAAFDFDIVLSELLDDRHLGRHATALRGHRVTIECTGVFADTRPSVVLSRLLLGQLVDLQASLALILRPLPIPSQTIHGPPARDKSRVIFTLETREERDPDEVTRRLSLTPTQTIRVGEHIGALQRPSPRAAWKLEQTDGSPNVQQQLADLLGKLKPRADAIASLTTHHYDGIFSLVGSFRDQVPEVDLARDQLALIRSLGAEIDIDLEAG